MTAIWMDGFDTYGSGSTSHSAMGLTPNYLIYPSSSIFCGVPAWGTAPTGPFCLCSGFGQHSADANGANGVRGAVGFALTSNVNTLYTSFRFAMDALPLDDYSTYLVAFANSSSPPGSISPPPPDPASEKVFSIGVTADGRIKICNDSNQTGQPLTDAFSNPGISAKAVLKAQQFHFIEIQYDVVNSVIIVRVDDPLADQTPALTWFCPTIIPSVGFVNLMSQARVTVSGTSYQFAAPGGIYADDWFIRDSSGSVNSGWLGYRSIGWYPVNINTAGATLTLPYSQSFTTGVLPADTVIVSAVQFQQRLAGLGSVIVGYTGPLGTTTSTSYSLTGSGSPPTKIIVYNVDPDTSRGMSPASFTNEQFKVSIT